MQRSITRAYAERLVRATALIMTLQSLNAFA